MLNNQLRNVRLTSNFNEEVGHPNLPGNMIKVNIHNNYGSTIATVESNAEGTLAYFLPWAHDTGNYIILPNNPNGPNLFLTAELTGCYVGVQVVNNSICIRHYNFVDKINDTDDFERFNNQHLTYWLIPDKNNNRTLFGNSNVPHEIYSNYKVSTPVLFWGEYFNNQWTFYYQTPDKNIHLFMYL